MYTYLLSVSLLRIRSITPSPRLTDASKAVLAEHWVRGADHNLWPPESCFPQTDSRRPDAIAAQR